MTNDVRVYAQAAEAKVGHLRTAGGEHEVDLIVERQDGRVLAVDVKLSADVVDAIVVTTGAYAYRRADGIGVVPAALLGA